MIYYKFFNIIYNRHSCFLITSTISTIYKENSTDTKVSQTVTTTTGNYPILLGSSGQTANATQGAYFGKGITANPSTSTITATTFNGKATSAGTADSANKVNNKLSISLNGGTATEYDGSTARTININASSVGAATSGHNHDDKYLKLSGGTVTGDVTFNRYVKINAWTNYGEGVAELWFDGNKKAICADHGSATDIELNASSATKVKNALTFTGAVSTSYDGSETRSIAIPTVSDKKITITQGSSTRGSFTLNQNSDLTINLTDTNTWTPFKGATSTAAGTAGYISTVPKIGETGLYFKSDGSWGTPTNTTYNDVTTTEHGLMTATDKVKLNGIQANATAVSFSSSLSSGTKIGAITINGTSTNIYCQTNTDTHHAAYLYAGASSTAVANAQASNGSLYLNLVENGTVRNSHKITGSGATSVTSDTSGNITISSTNTVYTHPTTAGNRHIPTGGSSGQLLGYSASGTAKWVEGFTAITDTEIDSIITEVFG